MQSYRVIKDAVFDKLSGFTYYDTTANNRKKLPCFTITPLLSSPGAVNTFGSNSIDTREFGIELILPIKEGFLGIDVADECDALIDNIQEYLNDVELLQVQHLGNYANNDRSYGCVAVFKTKE